MRSVIFSLLLLLVVSSVAHGAKLDTSFRFSTIETEHFSIHFHQGLEEAARKASVMAEEVHGKLVGELLWQPSEKTQLVLIDDSDFTNGYAFTIPYNTIYVQVVPPSLFSTLGEYDDWLKDVITHEYAHILTSDPSRGYWKVTRMIFGKPLPWIGDPFTEIMFIVTAPPNTFMPRWWHEGNATWSESQFTGWGRGKGSFYDMVFRTAVAEKHIPRVDEINGDVPYWPSGNLPYMFGYRLQKYISDTYGQDAIGKQSIAQSGRFPYFLTGPAQELSGGKSYRDLYDDMVAAVTTEQEQKIGVLSTVPFTPLTTLYTGGENLSNPRYSPDGSRIAFTRRDPNDHTSVVITDRSGSKVLATFRRRYSDMNLSWSPDGKKLYFTQAEIIRGYDTYQDLYVYDLSRDSVTRLTHGKRLSEVDLSPDGRLFAGVVSSRGSQNLAIMEAGAVKKETPRLVTGYTLQRLSSPHWSPDGKAICYAVRDNTGHTTIRTYQVATGKDQPLFTVDNTVEYPIWSRDGSSIYYISDETGVFNLFAYDLREGKSYQVSHLLAGALQPDPSPDGRSVAVSSYSSRGFYIAEMAVDRSRWSEKRGPSLPLSRNLPKSADKVTGGSAEKTGAQGVAPDQAAVQDQPPAGASAAEPPAEKVTPYSVLKTVYPHFWLPRLSDDGSDKTVLGAYTAGTDVLSYNTYTLAADYSPGRKRAYFNLAYDNDYFYPTLSLRSHIQPYLYSDLKQKGDYYELNKALTLQASVPINFLERRYTFKGGYQLIDQKALDDLDRNGNFNGVPVFQGRRDNVFAGAAFDNRLSYPWSISYEEGRSISFLYRRYAREIGSDIRLAEYTAEWREYLRMPTQPLKHHVLYLKLAGGLADGDLQFGQQSFQVGGVPSEDNTFSLRGYPDRFITGKYVATGTLEYRAPIYNPMRGPGTLPFFFEKIHGAAFVDAGKVWDRHNDVNADRLKIGAGLEGRCDITIGYWLTVTPTIGVAHGFNRGGENQLYLTVYSSL